jgi:predicted S18 family serine protease
MAVKKQVNEEALIKDSSNKKAIIFIVLAFLIIVVILSILNIIVKSSVETNKSSKDTRLYNENNERAANSFFSLGDATKVAMHLPAVDADGNGTDTLLTVEATRGSGRTLTDIDSLLFWADTQHSIRIARRVAENITNKKMEDYDIIYTIKANASLIGGPSAGAAITIATIAALDGKKPKDNVMITGGINHDGTISPVSGILEKAKAAKEAGATLFLVPLSQGRDVIYEESEHCEVFGASEVCTTETKPQRINVEEEAGIEVREVETIQEAMGYFFADEGSINS